MTALLRGIAGATAGWLGWVRLLLAVSGIALIAADAVERPG